MASRGEPGEAGLVARLEPDDAPARVEALAGQGLTVRSPRAFAPGAPVALWVRLGEGDERRLEARTQGSRRRPDGAFEVRMRLVNLRRPDREALAASLQKPLK